MTLAENLEVEAQALRSGEKSLLPSVDDGERLTTMQGRVDEVVETGGAAVPHYTFDALHVVLVHTEGQSGLSLGFESSGDRRGGHLRGRRVGAVADDLALRAHVRAEPADRRALVAVDTQPNDLIGALGLSAGRPGPSASPRRASCPG